MASAHRPAHRCLRNCRRGPHRRAARGGVCLAWCSCCGSPKVAAARSFLSCCSRPAGALLLVFACYGFSPDAFSYVFRSASGFLWLLADPAQRFFSTVSQCRHPHCCGSIGCCSTLVCAARATLATPLRCSASSFSSCSSRQACQAALALGAAIPAHVRRRSLCRRASSRSAERSCSLPQAAPSLRFRSSSASSSLPGLASSSRSMLSTGPPVSCSNSQAPI